ncbi:MAG: hypothetical protein Fur0042_30590 [Cyanophyceae cyanobacterium]
MIPSPRVSVVIPAYNAIATIAATLDSLAAQTFRDFEVIIIDDGSTDGTGSAIAAWVAERGETRLRVHRQDNGGQAHARNRGIELAQGDYIAFLDADDCWSPDKLEAQVRALDALPTVGLAYSWSDCVDVHGRWVRPGSCVSVNGDARPALLLQNFLDNGSTPLIRRSVLAEVGGFDPALRPSEDWDLWLRISDRYPFVAIPVPQVQYRLAAYSASVNIAALERGSRATLERAFDRAPADLQALKRRSLANLYEYLFFQTFSGAIRRRAIPPAFRYLFQALRYDPALRRRPDRWLPALWKAIAMALLPNRLAQQLLNRFGKANHAHAPILASIRTAIAADD